MKTYPLSLGLIATFLILYTTSIPISMAGMEIFSWTVFLFTLPLFILNRGFTSPWPKKMGILLLSLLAWSVISAFANGLSWPEIGRLVGYYRWIILLFTFYYVFTLRLDQRLKAQKFIKRYGLFFAGVALLTAVYGIYQYYTGDDIVRGDRHRMATAVEAAGRVLRWRSSGFFSMPLTYAYSFGMIFCLLFGLIAGCWRRMRLWHRGFSLVVLISIFASIVTSYTRGGWIAILCALIFACYFLLSSKISVSLLVVGTLSFIALYSSNPHLRERINTLTDMSFRSNSERIVIWQANLWVFEQNPVFGAGFDRNSDLLKEYLKMIGREIEYPGHAHSNYLQYLSTTGLVGFLLFCLIAGYFFFLTAKFYYQNRQDRFWSSIAVGLFSGQVMFHVGGLTECNFFDSEVRHLLVFIWAFVLFLNFSFRKHREQVKPKLVVS